MQATSCIRVALECIYDNCEKFTTEADEEAAGCTDWFPAIPITNAVTINRQMHLADTTASQWAWTGGDIIPVFLFQTPPVVILMLPSTFTPVWLHVRVYFRLNLHAESTSRQFTLKQIMQEEVTGQQINVKQEKIKTNIEKTAGSMTSLATNLKHSPLQLKIPL